ncbi:catalase [Campylobacter fetus]|uniref:catalase n=1 Tax=Campylobacter fetus TaxID=196 RepID=UPI00070F1F28|nr:catalase [Campylobacter fetus]EGK8199306.1 catalase [Campylobacter fetus]
MNKVFSFCAAACLFVSALNAEQKLPSSYSAEDLADIFYQLNYSAEHPKAKINHTKGFCASGVFEPSKEISKFVNVPLFKKDKIDAQIRYSLGGAIMDDKSKPRGMAIKMQGDGDLWTMVMLNLPIVFAKNAKEFGDFFKMRIPVDGKVDSDFIKESMQKVNSYRNFDNYINSIGITSSVANTPFFSAHTFWFKSAKDDKMIAAKWRFEPVSGVKYLNKDEEKTLSNDYLSQRFKEHVKSSPVEYKMYLTLANENDPVDDPATLWKGKHKEVLAGTLKVYKYDGEGCNSDVYFPSEIPSGVGAPKDKLFDIRNEVYAITFGRRQ